MTEDTFDCFMGWIIGITCTGILFLPLVMMSIAIAAHGPFTVSP